jgi:hypothetical protein
MEEAKRQLEVLEFLLEHNIIEYWESADKEKAFFIIFK